MALPIPPIRHSPAEYLQLEFEAEFKSEYLDGQIYAMTGASPRHSRIAMNLAGHMNPQLKGTPCRAYSNDTKVRTPSDSFFGYPDMTVVCGEPTFSGKRSEILDNPTMIVEILSPSTEAFDRGRKFARYREIRSLTSYSLISQDEPRLELYLRQSDDSWVLRSAFGLDCQLEIPTVNCSLRLADVYDGEVFDAEDDSAAF